MNKRRWIAAAFAALLFVTCLVGCGEEEENGSPSVDNGVSTVYADKEVGFQLDKPSAGDTVAIMHTSMGDISIRLFPEAAPKAVENFTTHAKNGYYNGLTFHRVMEDFMIQGGDPKGDGTGGESIWGSAFVDEFDQKLINLRGSLAMANSGVNTNGSQFFINQAGPSATALQLKLNYEKMLADYQNYYDQYADTYGDSFKEIYPDVFSFIVDNGDTPIDPSLVPDAVWDLYAEHGGNMHLDGAWRHGGGHTVFGQVYDGMDVVDAIAAVETDSSDKPTTPVTITSIEIKTYAE